MNSPKFKAEEKKLDAIIQARIDEALKQGDKK